MTRVSLCSCKSLLTPAILYAQGQCRPLVSNNLDEGQLYNLEVKLILAVEAGGKGWEFDPKAPKGMQKEVKGLMLDFQIHTSITILLCKGFSG